MTDTELQIQRTRIETYAQLRDRADGLRAALAALDTPFGTHKQSAFTGNTRESRRIAEMKIWFTRTIGGEAPVDLALSPLDVPATEVGALLRNLLTKELAAVRQQMETL